MKYVQIVAVVLAMAAAVMFGNFMKTENTPFNANNDSHYAKTLDSGEACKLFNSYGLIGGKTGGLDACPYGKYVNNGGCSQRCSLLLEQYASISKPPLVYLKQEYAKK